MGKLDPMEVAWYKMCGYCVENIQATEDFKEGLITEREMWRILNKNIKISIDYYQEKAEPRKSDMVRKHNSDYELVYGKINWINRKDDEVYVYWFLAKDGETFNLDDFSEYSSKGGRTMWIMQDD